MKTYKIKTAGIQKAINSRERVGKAYSSDDVRRNKKRKFAKDLHTIHERINRRARICKYYIERTKADNSKEAAMIKKIRQGKIQPVGEAANSAYGHLFGIDA